VKGEREAQSSKLEGEGYSNRRIALEFYCLTPGLEKEPVVLRVIYDGRVLDEIVFFGEKDGVFGEAEV